MQQINHRTIHFIYILIAILLIFSFLNGILNREVLANNISSTQTQTKENEQIPNNGNVSNDSSNIINTDPVFSPEDRKIEMVINLSIGLKYTPTKFRNITTYKKAYNYSERSLDEKRILIEYWNLANTQGTLIQKKRIKTLIANIGIGLRDSPNAYESKDVFNRYYGYKEKNSELQSVLDKFWRMMNG